MSTAERLARALEALFGADMEHCMRGDGKEDQLEALQQAKDALAAYRSTPADGGGQGVMPLTDEQIEKGREAIFSTSNPFCPCDSKTMRKAVRWAERAHRIGTPASTGGEDHA